MDINPHKIEEPTCATIPDKTAKTSYIISALALAVMASLYYYMRWFNNNIMKDYPTITHVDGLLYPIRQEIVRQKQGSYLIEKARQQEKLGEIVEAKALYSRGLEKSPAMWAARLQLARLNRNTFPTSSATLLLRDGFEFSADVPRYIDAVVNFAWASRDYKLMVDACDAGLNVARSAGDQKRVDTLTEQKAYALVFNGDLFGALAILPKLPNDATEEKIIERGALLLRIQLPFTAAEFLKNSQERVPSSFRFLQLLARAQRELNDIDGMEATLAKGIAHHPELPEAWSSIVINRSKSANPVGAREALNKYFIMFYGDPKHLTLVGQELASIQNYELLAECVAESDRMGYPGIDLREMLVELNTKRSGWTNVTKLLGEIAARKARLNLPTDRWQLFHESLCAAVLDPDPATQKAFLTIFREEHTKASALVYENFIKLLGVEGRVETALNIAVIARQRFPETRDWLQYARYFRTRNPLTDTKSIQ